jgi:tryptophan synthase alpha chain
MGRIDTIFRERRAAGRTAVMPFVTAGHPSLAVTEAVIPALEAAGASIIELGIPFSDPIADGPVIAASMHESLQAGTTPRRVFELVRRVRPRTRAGLVAMVSHSIVLRVGPERFLDDAAAAGFDGVILPDVDLRDAETIRSAADARSLAFVLLVAPTTSAARAERIVALCTGFVYVLARVGITGESDQAPEVAERVASLRECTDLPIAVGFGIARPEHVRAVGRVADAAIVGSALVRRMAEAKQAGADPVAAATSFVASLAAAGQRSPPARDATGSSRRPIGQ